MKRVLAVLGASVIGLAITGVVAPLMIVLVPSAWRGERIVWSTAAVVVACAAATSWFVSGRRLRP